MLSEIIIEDGFGPLTGNSFAHGSIIKKIEFPQSVTRIDANSFNECTYLESVVISSNSCSLQNSNAFTNTPIASGTGYIYVPDESVDDYKAATNWTAYANQIMSLSKAYKLFIFGKSEYIQPFIRLFAVYGPYLEEEGVIWSITNGSQYASIDQNGVVTVNESANASVITVKVTSIHDESKYDEKDITVTYSDGVLYNLESQTAFNNSNYIDTGVQLMSENIDWTIYVRGVVNVYESQDVIFHCIRESTPFPGISLDCINSSALRLVYMTNKTMNLNYTYGNEFELKLTHVAGSSVLSYSFTTNGNTVSGEKTDYTFTSVTQNLLIGAYQTTAGENGRFLNGTISEFYIKNYVE